MAVSVLLLELLWLLDFISGGNITGIAEYMFAERDQLALYLRILSSLFHLPAPHHIVYADSTGLRPPRFCCADRDSRDGTSGD